MSSQHRLIRRKLERECKQKGHLLKTDGRGEKWCARCGEPM